MFLRYERFERSYILKPEQTEPVQVELTKTEEKPLISFDEDRIESKLTSLNTNNSNAATEPDSLSVYNLEWSKAVFNNSLFF